MTTEAPPIPESRDLVCEVTCHRCEHDFTGYCHAPHWHKLVKKWDDILPLISPNAIYDRPVCGPCEKSMETAARLQRLAERN